MISGISRGKKFIQDIINNNTPPIISILISFVIPLIQSPYLASQTVPPITGRVVDAVVLRIAARVGDRALDELEAPRLASVALDCHFCGWGAHGRFNQPLATRQEPGAVWRFGLRWRRILQRHVRIVDRDRLRFLDDFRRHDLRPVSERAVAVGARHGLAVVDRRMEREVRRIRLETHTTDEAYASVLAARGKRLQFPEYFESRWRFLGLPVFAIAWGGSNSDQYRPRVVCAWLAVGDTAVSPLFAFGGLAVAPLAIGAITVGVLSLSLGGIAVGVLAVGSIAFGWWALGFVSAGLKCAIGFGAVARDYAIGQAASATETGTAAKEWLRTQLFRDFTEVILHHAHWWILLCVVIALGLREWPWPARDQRKS